MLDLRRAARACGCDLNATEADAAAAYPELGQVLKGADEAAVAARRGGADEGNRRAMAPVPAAAAENLHIPERHRCCTASTARHHSASLLNSNSTVTRTWPM